MPEYAAQVAVAPNFGATLPYLTCAREYAGLFAKITVPPSNCRVV